ncbi:MAG: divalent-cation tolerance protein CutA [Alphaproteobacteria bacterium]
MEFRSIYATAGSVEEAQRIGRALVEERLVACVNVLPGAISLYRWDGAVQAEPEAVFFAKTTAERAPAAVARIRTLHTYDVPCVLILPVEAGDPDYLRWIAAETQG